MSETEIKLFQLQKEISATLNMLHNVPELQQRLWNNSETISGKFPRAEIKLFQTDVDECWTISISEVTRHKLHHSKCPDL